MVFPIVALSDPRGPQFLQTWICTISGSLCVNLSYSGFVVLGKILKWPTLFCIFVIISTLKRTWPLICASLNSLYLGMSCTKFDWNWPAGSGEKGFRKFSVNFYSFFYYLPLRKGLSFTCVILNPLHLRIICANFGWNWLSSSGEEVENVKV
jgi:hypothetical protein